MVAFHVLQEMLTNALKHGDRSTPQPSTLDWASRGCTDVSVPSGGAWSSPRHRVRDGPGPLGHSLAAAASIGSRRVNDQIRVLLVDDQELFRSGLAIIIDAQPDMVVVGQASTGRDAVRLVEHNTADIVLMDIRMPEMDGVEATRLIFAPQSAARRTQPVRVIVLTTFSLDDRAARAIRYGASGFLLKDITPEHLRAAIRTVHAGNAVLAPDDLHKLLDGDFRSRLPVPAAYATLTDKETEVLMLVGRGMSNTEIAKQIYVSESTVKTHVGSILRKLDLRDRVQVVVFAHQHGLHP